MGFQKPPSILLIILFAITFTVSVVLLALSPRGWGRRSAEVATGIVGGVFGLLGSLLGVFWLLFTELYSTNFVKWIIVALLAIGSIFGLVAGILWSIAADGLLAAFGFLVAVSCVVTIVFVIKGSPEA